VESALLTLLIKRNISFYWLLIPSGVISNLITTFLRLFSYFWRSYPVIPSIYLDIDHLAQRIGNPLVYNIAHIKPFMSF
jgi:hypothetical protein